jgi:hypothetical protein
MSVLTTVKGIKDGNRGATTLSIMTFSIMTLSIRDLYVTLSKRDSQH